jgi:3-hydroxyacyl-CoA dehydrogenase / enoyl-CoA hydratase / 3-hydroxybutyryl-CoA epimerase
MSQANAFSLDKTPDGIAVVTFDLQGESVNKLSSSIGNELAGIMDEIERDKSLRAVILRSGKPDCFIVGADVFELDTLQTERQALELIERGHKMMDRLADFTLPVVAAIHGPALGGGLEVALACDWRVCSDDPATVLGTPEVKLGLLPAAGGTQRLPRLVGLQEALDILLTGKNVYPRKAKKIGLVDEVVFVADLMKAARKAAIALADGSLKPDRPAEHSLLEAFTSLDTYLNPKKLAGTLLESNPLGHNLIFDQAKKQVLRKSRGLYPAPIEIIECVRTGLKEGMKAGLEAERKAFARLVPGSVSKNLRSIFFATTALKKEKWVDAKPEPVQVVGVLGGGLMGSGIASVLVDKGNWVRVKDVSSDMLKKTQKYAWDIFGEKVEKKAITRAEAEERMTRLTTATDYSGFRTADLVIEAVFEDLALKHRVIREAEAAMHEEAILASNTSSIPIGELAAASVRPEQFVGMHFFSPVEKMPLIEVIVTPKTADWVTATAVEVGKRMGKTVIVVRDGAGFYTSRVLGPYVREAAYLLMDGARIEEVDEAAMDLGFPVGPITLLDEVGIDVASKIIPILHKAFGERFAPMASMEKLIADKRYGKKNKRGFYLYEGRKRGAPKQVDESVYALFPEVKQRSLPKAEMQQRLMMGFCNEAALCLEEGILYSPRDGDIGAIFGLGFPPQTGGPFRYMDALGIGEVVRQLEALQQRHGVRFQPARSLIDRVKSGKRYHG